MLVSLIPGVGPLLAPVVGAGLNAAGVNTEGQKQDLFASGGPLGLGKGGMSVLSGIVSGASQMGMPGPGGQNNVGSSDVGSDIGEAASVASQLGMSFALGTDYVPRTGLAMVHKGERVTPAEFNPAIKENAMNDNSGIHSRLDQLIGIMGKPQRSFVTTGDFYSGNALGQGQLSDISL
jgi:hypothetical protein